MIAKTTISTMIVPLLTITIISPSCMPQPLLQDQHHHEQPSLSSVVTTAPSPTLKKQGILEIPKQAASIIRNYIDRRLQSYLNLTTPKPDPAVPPELTNSILGHLLLGHLFATQMPTIPLSVLLPTTRPIQSISNDQETTPPPHPKQLTNPPLSYNSSSSTTPPSIQSTPPLSSSTPPVEASTTPPVSPSKTPPNTPTFLSNNNQPSYGELQNTPDEVYWIGNTDVTRPSVVISAAAAVSSSNNEPDQPTTSTTADEDDEEETDVDDFEFFKARDNY